MLKDGHVIKIPQYKEPFITYPLYHARRCTKFLTHNMNYLENTKLRISLRTKKEIHIMKELR